MSTKTPEGVIIRAIHEAFIKYPEGDGGTNLDYQWVQLNGARTSPRPYFWNWQPTASKL
jgi:hypothetical protein